MKTTEWDYWWKRLYAGGGPPAPYNDDALTYARAGQYLSGPGLVEEWGCATTWGKRFIGAPYRGVDGSPDVAQWGGTVADLREYRSDVPKALMRHVLEHNWEWRTVLENFLASFTDRAVLILFLEPGKEDYNVPGAAADEKVPALSLCEEDLFNIIEAANLESFYREIVTDGFCPPDNYEQIIFLEKHAR